MVDLPLEAELALASALLGICDIDPEKPAWQKAILDGWDMSLVSSSLRRAAAQRLHEHDLALQQIEILRSAFVDQHAEFRTTR